MIKNEIGNLLKRSHNVLLNERPKPNKNVLNMKIVFFTYNIIDF